MFWYTFNWKGDGTGGYDCVKIPGAMKNDLTPLSKSVLNASMFCGNEKGLGTTKDGSAAKTVCSKYIFMYCLKSQIPIRILSYLYIIRNWSC